MAPVIKIEGGHPLKGTVRISGSKNSTVALIPACVLANEPVTIFGVPEISDVQSLMVLLEELGVEVEEREEGALYIDPTHMNNIPMVSNAVTKLRASYYFMGALLGKFGHAEIRMPGGCYLGPRPIDLHLKGFEALGATIQYDNGCYILDAPQLVGTNIFLDISSVGATINIMMAASMAKGNTIIENAAREPHVVDAANFLNSMGANIKGAGTDVIRIRGVEKLHRTAYAVVPDMIEAGTYMFAAAATRGDVLVRNVIPKHLEAMTAKLLEIGCYVEEFDDAVRISAKSRLRKTHVKTLPYPGFPTDMQPQMSVVLCTAQGTSIVTESIFENRFKYADELSRMGANIKVEGNTAIIDGTESLTGARISAPDLRAGAALVIAGLVAEGITVVDDIVYILRGYEDFDVKLRSLGAEIQQVKNEREIQKFRLMVG
ncbi:MAG: UDP-N-acetylglucosamine 1-carboxyvinyltransferase [Erysipelotrichaceae bacterium]|nr:UDP-N-acetylglucosamine 1-carboxyvinyltransferase [Erysipelotrichaceae bacterium]